VFVIFFYFDVVFCLCGGGVLVEVVVVVFCGTRFWYQYSLRTGAL